jgi:Tol biopolymer transport system component
MVNLIRSRVINHRQTRRTIGLGFCAISLLFASPTLSRKSVRSELIQLQKQNGLSLVSVRDNRIYTIEFENRKLHELATLPLRGTVTSGSFSENGEKIAVGLCRDPGLTHPTPNSTDCPGGFVLAIMRSDGSDVYEYADFDYPARMCWSHDSSKLALDMEDRRNAERQLQLQILDLATGVTQVIADGLDSFVDSQCWSPDDKHVVYTSNNMAGHGTVSMYDLDLKTSREFSNGTRATWSPDGKWIALLDCPPSLWGCEYYLLDSSGSKKRQLLTGESATALWWSPDSRFVAYVNSAHFFERTPAQQLREMVRLRVRRLDDNSENSFADFFDGDTVEFQWVKMSEIKFPAP